MFFLFFWGVTNKIVRVCVWGTVAGYVCVQFIEGSGDAVDALLCRKNIFFYFFLILFYLWCSPQSEQNKTEKYIFGMKVWKYFNFFFSGMSWDALFFSLLFHRPASPPLFICYLLLMDIYGSIQLRVLLKKKKLDHAKDNIRINAISV